MTIKQNTKTRQHYVIGNIAGMNTRMATPFKNSKKATKLTITSNGKTIEINGRQVRALRDIITKAYALSSRS